MEQYYSQLVNYIAYRMTDRSLAADIVHDAYVKVIEVKAERELEYPQAFLYKAATNLMFDYFRLHKRRGHQSMSDVENYEGQPLDRPQDHHYQLQRVQLVEQALSELSSVCRTAFLLRKLEGLGHPEISAQLNISQAMVEKHIVVAMRHCKNRVREMESSG